MRFKDKFILRVWNVGVVETGIENIFKRPGSMKIRWVKHKYRDRFFADPFLLGQDRHYYYILVEEYIFCEEKGRITCLTVDKKTMDLVNREIILNEERHLSYPFVFGNYIIPEGHQSGATYAYKRVNGNEVYQKIKLVDDALVDPTLLRYGGKYWLFATTKKIPADAVTKLSIFHSNRFGGFIPHELNPVKTDIKTARPAGRFFTCQGKLYRPAMDSEKIYGHLIRIMEVKKLSEEEYEEQEVLVLSSRHAPPYNMGLHTFNVYENCVIVDGYREYHSYLIKPCIVKLKRILLYLYKKYDHKGKEIPVNRI